MRHSFSSKHRLYTAPQQFEKCTVPVIVEGLRMAPAADGEKHMRLVVVLVCVQFKAAFKCTDVLFVLLKNDAKLLYVLWHQRKFYHTGQWLHVVKIRRKKYGVGS
jgi:hypothetical protein